MGTELGMEVPGQEQHLILQHRATLVKMPSQPGSKLTPLWSPELAIGALLTLTPAPPLATMDSVLTLIVVTRFLNNCKLYFSCPSLTYIGFPHLKAE